MGQRTSIYLSDELAAMVKAARIPLAELVRRGLNAGGPIDETTLRHVLREELANLPAPNCQGATGYSGGNYEPEPYLTDP